MANPNLPRGFRPYGRLAHVGIYGAGGTIFPGDMVALGAGTASTTQYRGEVIASTAGAASVGVALNYATAGQTVRVADDPQQLFVGQASAADFDNNTDLSLNANILATAGSATYKQSRMVIASATLAVTATLDVKVLGFVPRQDGKNEMGGFAELIFKINNHQLSGGTGTLAV